MWILKTERKVLVLQKITESMSNVTQVRNLVQLQSLQVFSKSMMQGICLESEPKIFILQECLQGIIRNMNKQMLERTIALSNQQPQENMIFQVTKSKNMF